MENLDEDYLATGFRDVDRSIHAAKLVSCLSFMRELPSFMSYKNHVLERLGSGPGDAVGDVGCGPGEDVLEIGRLVGKTGRALGVDSSAELIRMAGRSVPAGMPQVEFLVGDGERLGLEDDSLDGAKIDRTLMHVERPQCMIKEMYRVVRPGGRIVCTEPDWGTFTITSADRETTRLVAHAWCDSFRHGWIGRSLKPMLIDAGLRNVEITGHVVETEGFNAVDKVYDLTQTIAKLKQSTSSKMLDKWLDDIRQKDRLIATVTLFMASGTK